MCEVKGEGHIDSLSSIQLMYFSTKSIEDTGWS